MLSSGLEYSYQKSTHFLQKTYLWGQTVIRMLFHWVKSWSRAAELRRVPELEGRDSYLGSFPPRQGRGGPGGPTWMPVPGLRRSWESLPDAHPGDVEVLGAPPECPSQGRSSPGGSTRMPIPGVQQSWGPRPDAHPGDMEVLGVSPRCLSQGRGCPVGPAQMLVLGALPRYPSWDAAAEHVHPALCSLPGPPVGSLPLLSPSHSDATSCLPHSLHLGLLPTYPVIPSRMSRSGYLTSGYTWPASLGCVVLITLTLV